MERRIIFTVENDRGLKIDVPGSFFKINARGRKIDPRKKIRYPEDVAEGETLVYIGKRSRNKSVNDAYSKGHFLTPGKKYKIVKIFDFSSEESFQEFLTEQMLNRGW